MQRTSENIGTIAAALAKALAELTNPEKLLVATIQPDGSGAAERTFRYAPLSSGLEIAQDLGPARDRHLQTTSATDTSGLSAGMLKLKFLERLLQKSIFSRPN